MKNIIKNIAKKILKGLGVDTFNLHLVILLNLKYHALKYGFEFKIGKEQVSFIKGDRKILVARKDWIYVDFLAKSYDYYFESIVPSRQDGFEVLDFSRPGDFAYRR